MSKKNKRFDEFDKRFNISLTSALGRFCILLVIAAIVSAIYRYINKRS